MTATPPPPRYPELESLRGLAACVVVIHHCLLTSPLIYPYNPETAVGWVRWLTFTPLHLAWAGYEAVVLFFVLSGFVLTLGIWQGKPLKMEPFIVRRIWRIWVPFMPVVGLAYLANILIGSAPLPNVSSWFNSFWVGADVHSLLEHLLMLNRLDQVAGTSIGVVWTLKYEMWLSLLLPIVVLLASQRYWMALLLVGTCNVLAFQVAGDTFPRTMQFLPMFVVGALLARFQSEVCNWIRERSDAFNTLLLVSAGVLGLSAWLFNPQQAGQQYSQNDLSVTAGAALLIALALGWSQLRSVLLLRPLRWLGQVSFSVYLLHTLVLAVLVRLQFLPVWLAMTMTFPLTLILAGPYHRFVERPAMAMGRRLTQAQVPPSSGSETALQPIRPQR